jgi:hypothetical protein
VQPPKIIQSSEHREAKIRNRNNESTTKKRAERRLVTRAQGRAHVRALRSGARRRKERSSAAKSTMQGRAEKRVSQVTTHSEAKRSKEQPQERESGLKGATSEEQRKTVRMGFKPRTLVALQSLSRWVEGCTRGTWALAGAAVVIGSALPTSPAHPNFKFQRPPLTQPTLISIFTPRYPLVNYLDINQPIFLPIG